MALSSLGIESRLGSGIRPCSCYAQGFAWRGDFSDQRDRIEGRFDFQREQFPIRNKGKVQRVLPGQTRYRRGFYRFMEVSSRVESLISPNCTASATVAEQRINNLAF